MDERDQSGVEHVVGREPELAAVQQFVDGAPGAPALVLTGPAGIGKTTLWEAAVKHARTGGWTVLVARPSEAEAELSFAGLADLLDGVDRQVIADLPPAQRRALEVALALAEPIGPPPEPLAIAAGMLSVLRDQRIGERVLIAVDDAQWLDQASATALAFASRRALGERARLVLTIRDGHAAAIERDLSSRRLELGALSLAAARRLLSEQLGLSMPQPLMRRLVETADGNPLVVLELGRVLLERGSLELAGELPAPELATELFGARVQALPVAVFESLLAAALAAPLSRAEVAAAADPSAVAEAAAYGVLAVEGDRVRTAHPLLAAAARAHATDEQRRAVHLRLSRVLSDELRAAHHLALGTAAPDRSVASTIAAAAAMARRRGAARYAAELAGHAERLTPAGDPDEIERLLTLGEYLLSAGELKRLVHLFEARVEELPTSVARARAHLLLGDASDPPEHAAHLEAAIAESADHPALRSFALAAKVTMHAALLVDRIADAEEWAIEGLSAAETAAPEVERRAINSLMWARVLRGKDISDLLERFEAADSGGWSLYEASAERVLAARHGFRGEVAAGRAILERLVAVADERGETISSEIMRLHLCEMALRAGDANLAAEVLADWDEWSTLEELLPSRMRCAALLAALRGASAHAHERAAAARAIIHAETSWDLLEVARADGLAALFTRDFEDAAADLGAVWDHAERAGVRDPGVFPVAADLVQALAELGRTDEAARVTARLRGQSEPQNHPWGLATAARCEAVVALAAEGYSEESITALTDAASAYCRLGLGFERARTLHVRGSAERRDRKWGAARASLEQAVAGFEALGCTGWAEQARAELDRVGARRPVAEGQLTSAEARVVALAVEGRSNKEIAAELVVTVHTVEVHLSRAYAKLGVRSRRQLAQALATKD
jgi:DNA-binding CsgD family transcriptional regulator